MPNRKHLAELDKINLEIEKVRVSKGDPEKKVSELEGKEIVLEECAKGTLKNIDCRKVKDDIVRDLKEVEGQR